MHSWHPSWHRHTNHTFIARCSSGLPYACRLVAHHYYHTMLNATHINMAMWTAMLCLVLAAARGLEASRGTPQAPCMA